MIMISSQDNAFQTRYVNEGFLKNSCLFTSVLFSPATTKCVFPKCFGLDPLSFLLGRALGHSH